MNAKQALKEAQSRWGKNAIVREDKKCTSTSATRQSARDRLKELLALPEPDKKTKEQQEARQDASSKALWYRYSVGSIALGLFFEVRGQGDTWEEAFEAAAERDARYYGKKTA